jgi:starch-binding outer membrane protein, SusD/RagB family
MQQLSTTGRWLATATVSLLAAGSTACSTDLLTVQQPPSLVTPERLQNATGATAIANAARRYVGYTFMYWDPSFYDGIFSDELMASYSYAVQTDRRALGNDVSYHFAWAYAAPGSRINAWVAIEFIEKYVPALEGMKAEMYAYRAMMENFFGEDMCDGLAFNELIDGQRIYGDPLTWEGYFDYALKDADSAVKYLHPDSVFARNLTHITRGYILLNQGKFAEAAAEVASVPTNFLFSVNGIDSEDDYYQWNWDAYYMLYDRYYDAANSGALMVMADKESGEGLDFISSDDPRIKPFPGINKGYGVGNLQTQGYIPKAWYDTGRAVSKIIYRGVEARLIEAEALLASDHNDASGAFLKKLNDLRADVAGHGVAGLGPLPNPGSYDARVNLLYREYAFWTYLQSKRLGALRRLVHHYGRNPDAVFPSGIYDNPFTGETGLYEQAISMSTYTYYDNINPKVHGCVSQTR